MNLLKRNIAANFAGSLWQALMSLVFVPVYIHFLGIEAWGLIGIFATLQTVFGLLDVGLSGTLSREMARLSVVPNKEQEMRDLVRTLEAIYWCVAGFVGLVAVSSSSFIAHHWINESRLSATTVEQALVIMGVVMALQMPSGFYSGGLMGLQRQVLLNAVNVAMSTLRGAGAILILWLVSPTIQAFFLWQLAVGAVNTVVLAALLWRGLPSTGSRAVARRRLLRGVWRFSAGMGGIAVLATILTQLDKVILSRMLTLEMFGYYALASMVAMSLTRLYSPLFYSVYPKLTQLVSVGDREGLASLYHKSCQVIAVLVLPVAAVVAFFSRELLLLWTHNPSMADGAHRLVTILICGTAINGLMNFPYALQLAHGWTKLSFYTNVLAVILVAPLIVVMTSRYGAIGAASVWLALNVGLIVFEIPVMHRRLLREEQWRWYGRDVGVPLAVCILAAGLGRALMSPSLSPTGVVLYLVVVSAVTLGLTALSTPVTRDWLVRRIFRSAGSENEPGPPRERTYYAEHATDKIIRETYFPDFDRRGLMVEVGGGTPDFLSMSKHFRDSGWRTIVFEPNPEFARKHREAGNEVYEYACSSEDRDGVPFTVVSQNVEAYGGVVTDHAFSSLALKPSYAATLPATAVQTTITVDVRRLDGVLIGLGISKVDLLSIDVEGWEIEVLKGFDTTRIDCAVIVVENLNHDPAYTEYMRGIGYTLGTTVEYNYVYTKIPEGERRLSVAAR